jgi:hypothetical protein
MVCRAYNGLVVVDAFQQVGLVILQSQGAIHGKWDARDDEGPKEPGRHSG